MPLRSLVSRSCCPSPVWKSLSKAAARAAGARMRAVGVLRSADNWRTRLAICRTCLLRTVSNGVSLCGPPYLRQLHRTPADGCGCRCEDKAKRPAEHCPLTIQGRPLPTPHPAACTCQWCAANAD